jgi:hypothetical protein
MMSCTKEPAGIIAIWNDAEQRYEVNSQYIDQPGLPEHVALMGRFMAKHFRRCTDRAHHTFWNSFRNGVTDYILSTTQVPIPIPNRYQQDQIIDKALRQIEAELSNKRESVFQLALALLDRYDCDWTEQNLKQKIMAINEELKLMPPEIITRAFATAVATR